MRDIASRVVWTMVFLVSGLLLLGWQLHRLTVTQRVDWQAQAEQNILRELPEPGARGAIFDRKGRPLATSEPTFAAVLYDQDLDHIEGFLPELTFLLTGGDSQKAADLAQWVRDRVAWNVESWLEYEPLTIARNLDKAVVTEFVERQYAFPGVALVTEFTRTYPNGKLGGAVLGYVGPISAEEMQDLAFAGYDGNEIVGKNGLELFYQEQLRGRPGHNSITVDPLGRPVGQFSETPPTPGNNLYLTIDNDLQRVAEEALARQIEWIKQKKDPHAQPIRGMLVAQDVRTGAILAMASVPTYDPNQMTRGVTVKEWEDLTRNQPGALVNWAIQGFAPGSTYKMVIGLAGLESGAVGPFERINCPAQYWRFTMPKNWKPYDDGPTDIARGLATSCNPYFMEVGYRTGIDQIAKFASRFGFGQQTGIDLPGESPGINPTQASYGDRWGPGQVISVAIGQGDVQATPLQLANYTAAIAMNGIRYKPYLVSEVRSHDGSVVFRREPEQLQGVPASASTWQRLQDGLRLTVTSPEGTGYLPFQGFAIPVAAKTGSAETASGIADGLTVAYAPYDKPEIAVSVIIEGGSTGSWTSPVARRVMARYFGIKDTLPANAPTYRD